MTYAIHSFNTCPIFSILFALPAHADPIVVPADVKPGYATRFFYPDNAHGNDQLIISYNTAEEVCNLYETDCNEEGSTHDPACKHKLAATQGSCPGCTNTQVITYDANGFKKSRTDFEGNLTAYTYNDSGLPESISKGMGDDAKTVQTTWDTQHRKPKLIVAQEQTTVTSQ